MADQITAGIGPSGEVALVNHTHSRMGVGGVEEARELLIVLPAENADEMLPRFIRDEFHTIFVGHRLLFVDRVHRFRKDDGFNVVEQFIHRPLGDILGCRVVVVFLLEFLGADVEAEVGREGKGVGIPRNRRH